MNLFKVVKTSYLKSLKGEEKLWKVIWLWGFFLYAGSIAIGFGMVNYHHFIKNILGYDPAALQNKTIISDLVLIPFGMLGVFGLILLIVYPAVFVVSLFRCDGNGDNKKFFYKIIVSVIFAIIHIYVSVLLLIFGSVMFLMAGNPHKGNLYLSSISGVLMAVALAIFIRKETIKSLTKKP